MNIYSQEQYEKALKRFKKISNADLLTEEGMEAQQLSEVISEYENKIFKIDYDLADSFFYEDYS